MAVEACAFETERLAVAEWHRSDAALPRIVVDMLTPAVTRSLPAAWRGAYDMDRARRWIADRDAEGTTLLATERGSERAVGLLLLHEDLAAETGAGSGGSGTVIRIGYVLAEDAWRHGLGTELVVGFVAWCRTRPAVAELIAGVAHGNPASIRVLDRAGFHQTSGGPDTAELEYRLMLRATLPRGSGVDQSVDSLDVLGDGPTHIEQTVRADKARPG